MPETTHAETIHAETIHAETTHATYAPAATDTRAPAILAILFGIFLIFGTGLAGAQALHDAAHDSRHSFAFPCH